MSGAADAGEARAVAYQGRPGAFSEIAARALGGDTAALVPCDTFAAAVAALDAGRVEQAVLPVVNAIAGGVGEALDLVATRADLRVAGAVTVPVAMALLAPPGVRLGDVRHVHSHPVALAQCGRFFAAHPHLTPVAAFDTAGAVEAVVGRGRPDEAALASAHAAALYGAVVLRAGVQDHPANATRFLALARPAPDRPGGPEADAGADLPVAAGPHDRCVAVWSGPDACLGPWLAAAAARGWEAAWIERRPGGSAIGHARTLVELRGRPAIGNDFAIGPASAPAGQGAAAGPGWLAAVPGEGGTLAGDSSGARPVVRGRYSGEVGPPMEGGGS